MKKNGLHANGMLLVTFILSGLPGCDRGTRASREPLTAASYTREDGYATELADASDVFADDMVNASHAEFAENEDSFNENDDITEIALNDLQRLFDASQDDCMDVAYDDSNDLDDMISNAEMINSFELDRQFETICFDYDKAVVSDEKQKNLISMNAEKAKVLLEEMEACDADAKLVVNGHSCKSGTANELYNVALSEQRAEYVVNELANAGIPRDKMVAHGMGTAVPACIDGHNVSGDKDEQALNRRVEIALVS